MCRRASSGLPHTSNPHPAIFRTQGHSWRRAAAAVSVAASCERVTVVATSWDGEQSIGQMIGHQADFVRNLIVSQHELVSTILRADGRSVRDLNDRRRLVPAPICDQDNFIGRD
jgi:hypothetical protein